MTINQVENSKYDHTFQRLLKRTKCTEMRDVTALFKRAEDTNYQLACDATDYELD